MTNEEMVSACCSANLTEEGRCTDCKEFSELVPTE